MEQTMNEMELRIQNFEYDLLYNIFVPMFLVSLLLIQDCEAKN